MGPVVEWREEVEREDERAFVVELVHDSVVGGRQADQEVLGLGRHEPAQQLVQPSRGVLGRATAARRQRREALRH